jgi:hypothetical protein
LHLRPHAEFGDGIVDLAKVQKGRWPDFAQQIEKEIALTESPEKATEIHQAYERGGYKAVSQKRLEFLEARSRKMFTSPINFAYQYAFLNDKQTLKSLEDSFRDRSPGMAFLQNEPLFNFVHDDPRYKALVKKWGSFPFHDCEFLRRWAPRGTFVSFVADEFRMPSRASLWSLLPKSSHPYSYLYRVQTRVERPQTCIRNMQIANFDTPVIFLAEDMRPQRRAGTEVHGVGKSRNIVKAEQHSPAQLQIR